MQVNEVMFVFARAKAQYALTFEPESLF